MNVWVVHCRTRSMEDTLVGVFDSDEKARAALEIFNDEHQDDPQLEELDTTDPEEYDLFYLVQEVEVQ